MTKVIFTPLFNYFLCLMGVIYIMLIVSFLLAVFFLASYIWANKTGQYDDDVTPGIRMLYDDEEIIDNNNK